MATFGKFNAYIEYQFEGVIDLGSDQIVVGLTTNANAPVAGNSVLADITEISYTNLSSRNVTTAGSAQTSGTYKLTMTDLTLTASGAVATFRHTFHYDDTPTSPADPLLCRHDYGGDVTLANGETFTFDYDGANGLLQAA